jgi:N,N'-diacetyllegionaminate synthase
MITNGFFNAPYTIAEIGQAHDGSLGTAHAYIDAVAQAGAQAIKFQTHYAEEESTPNEPWRIKFSTQDTTRFEYWKRMEFTPAQWIELADHAKSKGLDFMSSPFSLKAVNVLLDAGIDAWKIASGEVNNILLLEAISETGLPVILSTGMSPFSETRKALKVLQKNGSDVLIMQCTSSYPVEPQQLGLNLIQEFRDVFNVPVGLSDHSGNIYSSLAAYALGAVAAEVHVTLSKEAFGPDVTASLTLEQLGDLVAGSQWIHTAISNPVDKDGIVENFLELRKIFMKSFVARIQIPRGKVIDLEDIAVKKPATGISASEPEKVLGRVAARDIPESTVLTDGDIE